MPVADRRAVSERLISEAELAVHALAQLPDRMTTTLAVDAERQDLEVLAAAYGIRDRIQFRASSHKNGLLYALEATSFAELVESLYEPGDPPASLRYDDAVFKAQRVAIVTNIPSHYRLPLFAAIGARLRRAGAAFRVFFLSEHASDRPWLVGGPADGFEREMLKGWVIPVRDRPPHLPVDLSRRLAAFAPSIVLVGGMSPIVSGQVARFAHRRRFPWGLWSGEIDGTKSARSRLRHRQRLALLRSADFAIAYGHASAGYLRRLRPGLPIVYGRNSAPVGERAVSIQHPSQRIEALVVGDLASRRKGVDVAIDALRRRPDLRCRLTVVGGGRDEAELRQRGRGDNRIRFTGPLPPNEVRKLFSSADIVLFPTRSDVFGLVLVEAMGAGIATVVSHAAGAVADLGASGHNCLVVPSHEPEAWAGALSLLVEDGELRASLGAAGAETVRRRWTIDHAADAMLAGFRLGLMRARRS